MTARAILIPLALGLAAGLINFVVMRGATAPLELAAVKDDVKPGTELTEAMLEKVSVRADAKLFASAVPYSERGILIGARVGRALKAHEVVLFADVRQDFADDIRANLRAGEMGFTVPVRQNRITPSLKAGDEVGFLIVGDDATPRVVGPFRLVGFGERSDPFQGAAMGRLEARKVVVALPVAKEGDLDARVKALNDAIRQSGSTEKTERVLGVEHYRAGK